MSDSETGTRRNKRRCARSRFASTSMPSAVHYVGYVSGVRCLMARTLSSVAALILLPQAQVVVRVVLVAM